MKEFKLSTSDKRLLLLTGGVLLIVCAYFFIFCNFKESAVTLETENETLEERLVELQEMAANAGTVAAQTESMIAEREAIIARYPGGVTVESSIDRILGLEESTGLAFSETSFSLGNAVSTESEADIYAYYANLNLHYEGGYDQVKEFLSEILCGEDRATVTAITASYDSSTGYLSGTIALNLYYMVGTDVEYETPTFYNVNEGVSSLFGKTNEVSSVTTTDSESEAETEIETETETETE